VTVENTVELAGGIIVAVGSPSDDATFTLTEDDTDDRRAISVPSVSDTLAELTERCQHWPQSAAVCDDVLRSFDPDGPTRAGVITESLAYSTLQSGPEFARWLAERGPATVPAIPDPVQADRIGERLHVRFNRPQRHNAFSTDMRAALLEALDAMEEQLRLFRDRLAAGEDGVRQCFADARDWFDGQPTRTLTPRESAP